MTCSRRARRASRSRRATRRAPEPHAHPRPVFAELQQPAVVRDRRRAMTSTSDDTDLPTGGATPSRVGDINPDEIENIEVIKGPSAAALYGTAAANGVVVISTKRGRAGAAKWTASTPKAACSGTATSIRRRIRCSASSFRGHAGADQLLQPPAPRHRQCTLDSVAELNIFEEDDLKPVDDGSAASLACSSPAAPRRFATSSPVSAKRKRASWSCRSSSAIA